MRAKKGTQMFSELASASPACFPMFGLGGEQGRPGGNWTSHTCYSAKASNVYLTANGLRFVTLNLDLWKGIGPEEIHEGSYSVASPVSNRAIQNSVF